MSSATYRTLLRAPGAAAFFLTAAAGRVGIAMTSLGIVWLVHARTGSYATAGLVTAGFAVAEVVAGPQLALLADRFGQTRVLPSALLAHAVAVGTLLALVAAGTPGWLMAAGGVLAGATIPQLGALSAARWAALLRDERAAALPAAFALESLANELAYLAGPALVSILGASGYPVVGTVLAATLVVAGGLSFAAQRRTAPPSASGAGVHHRTHDRTGRSLLRPGFAVLAGVNLAIGGFFGAVQISVTAFAVEHGAAGTAAVLMTVSSCASLLAGWLYGLRQWRAAPRVQLAVAAAGLAAGCLPLLVAGSAAELGFGLALTGLAIPPLLVLCSVLAESAVDRAVLTQAFVWLNSASAAGSAGAAAVAGRALDAFGARGGFAAAAAAAGVMAVLAAIGLRALRVPLRAQQYTAAASMQQLSCTAPGRLEWRNAATPELSGGRDDALIRPLAVTRCDIDPMLINAGPVRPSGFAVGHEAIAEVIAVGPRVSSVAVGQLVFSSFQLCCGRLSCSTRSPPPSPTECCTVCLTTPRPAISGWHWESYIPGASSSTSGASTPRPYSPRYRPSILPASRPAGCRPGRRSATSTLRQLRPAQLCCPQQ